MKFKSLYKVDNLHVKELDEASRRWEEAQLPHKNYTIESYNRITESFSLEKAFDIMESAINPALPSAPLLCP